MILATAHIIVKIIFRYVLIFNSCVETLLEKLDGCGKNPVEIFEYIRLLTMDTMLQCAMSSQTNCQKIGQVKCVENWFIMLAQLNILFK